MHISFLFTLALPFFAALARPLPGGQSDLDLRADPLDVGALDLRSLSLDLHSLDLRELEDLEALLEARAKGAAPRTPPPRQARHSSKPAKAKSKVPAAAPHPKAPSGKITPTQQAERKKAVKHKVAANQKKKADLRDKAIDRKATNPAVKVPRPPRPPTVKGTPKTAKARNTQQRANEKQQERKAAGRTKFADAAAAHRATTNLPNRKHVYNVHEKVNGKVQSVKYTGEDARRAVFNSHLHKNNPVNFQPKTFENRLQGPKDNKSKPIPYMKGKGREFPLSKSPAGYKGEAPGAARVIIQPTKTGHKFQGVVAHDPALPAGHPGHFDHFLVHKSKH